MESKGQKFIKYSEEIKEEIKVILHNIELSYGLYIQPISHFLLYIV